MNLPIARRFISRHTGSNHLIGQPWWESHDRYLKPVFPYHRAEVYQRRRADLMAKLPNNSKLVIPSYGIKYGSQNIFYSFQQNNNLLYFSGFNEPNSCLVIENLDGVVRTKLFLKENDAHSLLWEGPVTGSHRAPSIFGVEEAHSISDLRNHLIDGSGSNFYHTLDENTVIAADVRGLLDARGKPAIDLIQTMRMCKDNAEQSLMREIGKLSAEAFKETMRWSWKTRLESNIAARMEFECRQRAAEGLAYVPVVGGGPRANIIHYTRNNQVVGDHEMVLMDAGGKFYGYCTDITRTWPINGRFSSAQRELYEAVLRIQEACIQACKLDASYAVNLKALDHLSTALMVTELGRLGFSDPERQVHTLYPHSIGHYIGLDLHDCPRASLEEPLVPGMLLTIEPGLYIPDDSQYPERFRGMGVRIEDDLLITEQSEGRALVLTEAAPKCVEEIEALLSS